MYTRHGRTIYKESAGKLALQTAERMGCLRAIRYCLTSIGTTLMRFGTIAFCSLANCKAKPFRGSRCIFILTGNQNEEHLTVLSLLSEISHMMLSIILRYI